MRKENQIKLKRGYPRKEEKEKFVFFSSVGQIVVVVFADLRAAQGRIEYWPTLFEGGVELGTKENLRAK